MKTNFVLAFLFSLSLALFSCEKNDTSPAEGEAVAADGELSEFALLATLSSSNARLYNSPDSASGGRRCNLTEIEVSTLSATITSYISTTYKGATIERAGTTNQGETMVHIKKPDGTSAVLLFDAGGNFVSEKTHKGGHGTPVAVADLPQSVTSYITSTYSGATIEKAIKDPEGKYVVLVKKTDGSLVGVAFDAEGNFTSELTMNGKFGGKGRGRKH